MNGANDLPAAEWLGRDLDHVLAHTKDVWEELRGASLFLTGGTGFFGHWLLHTLDAANRSLGLGVRCAVLTRDPGAFRRRTPRLASQEWLTLLAGDVRSFEDPGLRCSHIIHAATPASAALIAENPLEMIDIIVAGTRRVLEFSRRCGARKLLLCSSGAVYGAQPGDLEAVPETYLGGPDPLNPRAAYAEGKRVSELMCAAESRKGSLEVASARCFAFVGPYLPLDTHFAIGNFIRDALAQRDVVVRGDGTPLRSYLYAADLAIWLWTILARGASGRAYNVGSEEGVSIAQLARLVVETLSAPVAVRVLGAAEPGRAPERYVPSTARARSELNLEQWIDLPEAIRRTARAAEPFSVVTTV
jgi:dTDP-glucose 4,6-dehydratase